MNKEAVIRTNLYTDTVCVLFSFFFFVAHGVDAGLLETGQMVVYLRIVAPNFISLPVSLSWQYYFPL